MNANRRGWILNTEVTEDAEVKEKVARIFAGCGKTLLAVVAIRKRCRSAFWRNPTADTACGRVPR